MAASSRPKRPRRPQPPSGRRRPPSRAAEGRAAQKPADSVSGVTRSRGGTGSSKRKAGSSAKNAKNGLGEGSARKSGGAGTRGSASRLREDSRARRLLSRVSPRTAIVLVLVAFFIAFAFGPTMRNLEATSKLKQKEAELAREREYTASLEEEVEEASSLQYIEEEARKQRMVSPGEVLYVVTTEDECQEIEYKVKNFQSMDEVWERVRLMMNCGKTN